MNMNFKYYLAGVVARVWLCSDDCFVTGENIQPNGGLTLRGNPQSGDIERSVGAAMAARQSS